MKYRNRAEFNRILLNYAYDNDIVKDTDTLLQTMKKTREALLQLHTRSIYQRADGRWATHLGTTKPYRRVVRVNKEDLEDEIITYYLKTSHQEITFEACLDEWLTSEEQSPNPSIVPKTITNYRAEFKRFINGHTFCRTEMVAITERDVRRLLTDIINRPEKVDRKRFNSVKSLIANVFDYARMELNLQVIPIRQIMKELKYKSSQFTLPTKSQQVFYQKDLEALINHLLQVNTLISLGIALVSQTGLRVSEIAALRWEDVFESYLHVCRAEHSWTTSDGITHTELGLPKENKIRDVILSDEAKSILSAIRLIHPTGSGFVFLNGCKRATCRMFDYHIRKYCRACNIVVLSMHKLRKTYASVLLASGIPDKLVQSQLGHSDISTTQEHYNYNPFQLQEQIDAFRSANVMFPPVPTCSGHNKKPQDADKHSA